MDSRHGMPHFGLAFTDTQTLVRRSIKPDLERKTPCSSPDKLLVIRPSSPG